MKVFLALVLCFAMRAAEGPRIVEAESRLELRAGTAALKIGVESAQAVRGARVAVEWLDPSDEVVTSGSATVALVRGINHVTLALPSPAAQVDPDDHDELIWLGCGAGWSYRAGRLRCSRLFRCRGSSRTCLRCRYWVCMGKTDSSVYLCGRCIRFRNGLQPVLR